MGYRGGHVSWSLSKSGFLRDNQHSNIFPPWCYDFTPSRGCMCLQTPCLIPFFMHSFYENMRNHETLQLANNSKNRLPQGQSPLQNLSPMMLWSLTVQCTAVLALHVFVSINTVLLSWHLQKWRNSAIQRFAEQKMTSSRAINTETSSHNDIMILNHPGDIIPRCDHVLFNL